MVTSQRKLSLSGSSFPARICNRVDFPASVMPPSSKRPQGQALVVFVQRAYIIDHSQLAIIFGAILNEEIKCLISSW